MTKALSITPMCLHPYRPVIGWAVNQYFFALNLHKASYECWRRTESQSSMKHIEYFSSSATMPSSSSCDCWLLATDDKTIVILHDISYTVRERFLLRKRPVGTSICSDGETLIWGDRFGDLMKLSFEGARRLTSYNLYEFMDHLRRNNQDATRFQVAEHLKKQFSNHPAMQEPSDGSEIPDGEDKNDHSSVAPWVPFAGHMAAITSVVLTKDKSTIASADRDDKIRIGETHNAHVTRGYCLGHKELITSLCCIGNAFLASASGDKTIRLWNITGEGEEIQCIPSPVIILALYATDCLSYLLAIGEGIQGVITFKLQHNDNTTYTIGPSKTIYVPSTPTGVLPVQLTETDVKMLCPETVHRDSQPFLLEPSFYWIDHTGRLYPPVSVLSGNPLFDIEDHSHWIGMDIGPDIVQERVNMWKHNRQVSCSTGN